MAGMSNDEEAAPDLGISLALAIGSALSFGLSGPLAPVCSTPAAHRRRGRARPARDRLGLHRPGRRRALRGRWGALQGTPGSCCCSARCVAGRAFAYFSAVQRMDVGPALLIEYTAPAAMIVWLWLRRGERPGALTVAGAGLAALGLVLVLDLLSGAGLDPAGIIWALIAMACAPPTSCSATSRSDLPPVALAAARLATGALVLAALGAIGVLPMDAAAASAAYAGAEVGSCRCWGSASSPPASHTARRRPPRRRARLGSFLALLKVVAGIAFAWLLLDQLPGPLQLAGGALIVAGVIMVKLGERPRAPPPAQRPLRCGRRSRLTGRVMTLSTSG